MEVHNGGRKQRAIGILAAKITSLLPELVNDATCWEISVDHVIEKFGSSRGAAYEVFHVMEALLLVTKAGKNTYVWNGFSHLETTLCFLRQIGLQLGLNRTIKDVRDRELSKLVKESQAKEEFIFPHDNPQPEPEPEPEPKPEPEPEVEGPNGMASEQVGEKIQILELCQKFIMLFLVSAKPKLLSLEFASKVIHDTACGRVHWKSYLKSRTRRLYDISNVLMSLPRPIIRKVSVTQFNSAKRTAFQYCGPELTDDAATLDYNGLISLPDYRRKHLYFHLGKKLLSIPERPTHFPGTTTLRFAEEDHQGQERDDDDAAAAPWTAAANGEDGRDSVVVTAWQPQPPQPPQRVTLIPGLPQWQQQPIDMKAIIAVEMQKIADVERPSAATQANATDCKTPTGTSQPHQHRQQEQIQPRLTILPGKSNFVLHLHGDNKNVS